MKPITTLCLLLGTCLLAGAEGKSDGPGKPHRKGPPPEIIKKFDTDGDGKLSDDEKKAMRETIEERRKEKFKEFDTDGDGKLSDEEREKMIVARKAEMLKKFDTDGDGKLSEEERKAIPERPRGPKGKGRDFKPGSKKLDNPNPSVE